jgi:acyl-CoA thioester hydrolase
LSEKFLWPVRVYYEDTDVGGVVYYANYLKFMERARTEYLRARGFEQDRLMAEDGIMFAVVNAELTFRKAARFNDLLYVSCAIEEHTRTTVRFAQDVQRAGGELLCEGRIRAACLDVRSLRPRAIPDRVLEAAA